MYVCRWEWQWQSVVVVVVVVMAVALGGGSGGGRSSSRLVRSVCSAGLLRAFFIPKARSSVKYLVSAVLYTVVPRGRQVSLSLHGSNQKGLAG